MPYDKERPVHIDGFRFIRFLGRGGTGEVHLARELAEGHLVAVKLLNACGPDDDTTHERFFREAVIGSRLRHPNIVRVYELGEADGRYFMSMEFVNGPSLKDRLMSGALSEAEAASLLYPILDALDVAHRQGIVHCDLKPGNILLEGGTFPKLSDLGVAHTWGPIHGESPLPASGIATPFYVAPEQCRRDGVVDHRADIYSLGATFYHMLCGRPPFPGKTPAECMEHHKSTPAPDPRGVLPSLSEELVDIVLRMLEKNPEDRYENCRDIACRLESGRSFKVEAIAEPPPVPHEPEAGGEDATTKLPV